MRHRPGERCIRLPPGPGMAEDMRRHPRMRRALPSVGFGNRVGGRSLQRGFGEAQDVCRDDVLVAVAIDEAAARGVALCKLAKSVAKARLKSPHPCPRTASSPETTGKTPLERDPGVHVDHEREVRLAADHHFVGACRTRARRSPRAAPW